MTQSKEKLYFLIKIFLCIIMISALIALAINDLAPAVPLVSISITFAALTGVLLVVLGIIIIVAGSFNQTILRNDGTNPAWFWFNGEPPGLEKQRAALKELIKNENAK